MIIIQCNFTVYFAFCFHTCDFEHKDELAPLLFTHRRTRRAPQHTFRQPTFQCFLCQWPPASRAEDSQWGRKTCPPVWGCPSPLRSYCRPREGHRNPYLEHTQIAASLKHISLQHALNHKEG